MKLVLFFPGLSAMVWLVAGCASTSSRGLPTASSVDLKRYAGKWFEIARLPNSFQGDDGDATAEYTVQGNGTVAVLNTEYRTDGRAKTAKGTATAVVGSQNSRLRVKFDGLAALVPASRDGNYWIIQVDQDYSVALVGTPDRKFLWLLARHPKLDAAVLHRYLNTAYRLGFATEQMRYARTQVR